MSSSFRFSITITRYNSGHEDPPGFTFLAALFGRHPFLTIGLQRRSYDEQLARMGPFNAIAPSTFSVRIDLDCRFVIDNLPADEKNHVSFVSPYLRANLNRLNSYYSASAKLSIPMFLHGFVAIQTVIT